MDNIILGHEELLKRKKDLHSTQEEFTAMMKKTYPILYQDYEILEQSLDKEIEIALSSCLKFKTSRIEVKGIEGKGAYFIPDRMYLTRNPGLKAAYSSYSAFSFMDLIKVDQDMTLHLEKHTKARVKLGILKNNLHVDQTRLKQFLSFLRQEVVPLNKRIQDNLADRWDEDPNAKVEKIGIVIRKKDFSLVDKEVDWEWRSQNMADYHDDYYSKEGRIVEFKEEERVVEIYSKLHVVLLKYEKIKKEIVEDTEFLIKKFRDFNQVFRVTQELLK